MQVAVVAVTEEEKKGKTQARLPPKPFVNVEDPLQD